MKYLFFEASRAPTVLVAPTTPPGVTEQQDFTSSVPGKVWAVFLQGSWHGGQQLTRARARPTPPPPPQPPPPTPSPETAGGCRREPLPCFLAQGDTRPKPPGTRGLHPLIKIRPRQERGLTLASGTGSGKAGQARAQPQRPNGEEPGSWGWGSIPCTSRSAAAATAAPPPCCQPTSLPAPLFAESWLGAAGGRGGAPAPAAAAEAGGSIAPRASRATSSRRATASGGCCCRALPASQRSPCASCPRLNPKP